MTLDRGRDPNVQSDEQHTTSLADGGPEKRFASTKCIGQEQKENRTADTFDDTVDTGGEQASVVTLNTDVLKNQGGIVVDSIRASHLLTYHQDYHQYGSAAITGDQPHLPHQIFEASATHHCSFIFQLDHHFTKFRLDVFVSWRQHPDFGKNCLGLFPSILFGKPSR